MTESHDKSVVVIDHPVAPTEPAKAPPPASPPPPRGPSLWTLLALAIVGGVMLWVGAKWGGRIGDSVRGLFAREQAGEAATATSQFYTCGMHPWVIQRQPGLCPVCHMELTPLDPAKLTGKLEIDPVVVQNIGVRIAPVVAGPVTQTIRTVGTVDYNETAVRDVNLKLAGWIEKLHVDYLGSPVRQGQPLVELYSPDLYAAQQEYLLALRSAARSAAGTQPDDDVLRAVRTRLEYFDITPEQIHALEQRGQATKTMTIYSPYSGVVIAKNVFEGMRVEPGTQLYRIADLSSVWVMVTLYEYQLPYVQVGQSATMSLPYIPGQTFEGKVIYTYPTLDEKTRQVRVRLEFPNEQGLLKPGMFAEVQLHSTLAEDRVLVPREAIIDTGQRQVAFVSLGDGKFEPREVQMGVHTESGHVQVLAGLKPGEQVVISGQFLLDSESRVRESLAKMVAGTQAAEQKAPAAPSVGPSEPANLPPAVQQALSQILASYMTIGEKLAADTIAGMAEPAREVASAADRMVQIPVPGDEHFWHRHEEVATVRGEALKLAGQADLVKARLAYADLSVALGTFLQAVGVPPAYGKPVEQLHCPMYREGQGGATWLQPAGEQVRNPFFGKTMLRCFDKRQAVPMAQTANGNAPTKGHDNSTATQSVGALDELVRAYLQAHAALMEDDLTAARQAAAVMVRAAGALPAPSGAKIVEPAAQLAEAADLAAFRQAFATLSELLIEQVRRNPPTPAVGQSLYHAHCPMVQASWLQAGPDIRNPYDLSMPACGVLRSDNLIDPKRN